MITLAWWIFVPLVLLSLLGVIALVAIGQIAYEDRGKVSAQKKARRAVYLDWCARYGWCPEHDVPDDDGHALILSEPPWLPPCPGSKTRRVVAEGPSGRVLTIPGDRVE